MSKKIYFASIKKWYEENKASIITTSIATGTSIGVIIFYLSTIGAITITGITEEVICAGTIDDPCFVYINFTANEDVFLYPTNYDPWGRNSLFEIESEVESWEFQRSWGSDWRTIPLDKACTGTWCGAPSNNADSKYSVVFREGKEYQTRIKIMKKDPTENIMMKSFNKETEIKSIKNFYLNNQSNIKEIDSKKAVLELTTIDNNSFFNIEYELNEDVQTSLKNNTYSVKSEKKEIRIYEKPEGTEYELILFEKPDSNRFNYSIKTQGLDFFHQPPLHIEKGFKQETKDCNATDCDGSYRPENIVNSYAVYYSNDRKNNEYKTGKAYHIYRPWAEDATGNRIWLDMSINETTGVLIITIPQIFLDNATYPIIIDPTIGYTSTGATDYVAYSYINSETATYRIAGSYFLSDGTYILNETNFYIATVSTWTDKRIKIGVYEINGSGANNHKLLTSNEIEISTTTDEQWKTISVYNSSIILDEDKYYWIGAVPSTETFGGSTSSSERVDFRYDSGGNSLRYLYVDDRNTEQFLPEDWTNFLSATEKFSAYLDVTPIDPQLNLTHISPINNTDVTNNAYFNFTVNFCCSSLTDKDCNVSNVTLINNDVEEEIIVFNTTGNQEWEVPQGVTEVEVLVVAGGGGGGGGGFNLPAGGGGAGGVIHNTSYSVSFGETINVVVGSGGAGGTGGSTPTANAGSGQNSSFGTLEAVGGGYGSHSRLDPGGDGGSGGGGSTEFISGNSAGGSGIAGQGYDGGDGYTLSTNAGGGGGGASEVGGDGDASAAGDGGAGYNASSSFGTTYGENGVFGGGGGGGSRNSLTAGSGGVGGGGDGGYEGAGSNAMPNTGGGGGGSSFVANGGNGGSGIVIIKIKSYNSPFTTTNNTTQQINLSANTCENVTWSIYTNASTLGEYNIYSYSRQFISNYYLFTDIITINITELTENPSINLSFGPDISLFRFETCGPGFENTSAVPEGQNTSHGIDYICNNGTITGDIQVKLNSTLNTGWTWYASNTSTTSNLIQLTNSWQTIYSALTQDSCIYIWHKANCSFVNQGPGSYEEYQIVS